MIAELARLAEDERREKNWKRWGPYLSERQWGTVREDYSADGDCWEYFPHDHARSRAYRWGEDGLLGICDRECRLCFALALWNGRDPILKERLFGLTNHEGNHGEDVKECYYYLDSTPTHSYMKALYKYPQSGFPYDWLVEENRRRGREQPEFELVDTGIFDEQRYFDVFVEYAKAGPDDLVIRITAVNRGPERAAAGAAAHPLVPQYVVVGAHGRRLLAEAEDQPRRAMRHCWRNTRRSENTGWTRPAPSELLFTENETNMERLFGVKSAGAVCEGRVPRLRDRGPRGRRESAGRRHQGRRAVPPAIWIRARARPSICAWRRTSRDAGPLDADAGVRAAAGARPMSSTRRGCARAIRTSRGASRARPTPACCGPSSSYHYGVAQWLEGDPAQPPPPAGPRAGTQPRLEASLQSRRHLHAGQLGIPVVRRLGPGLPHDPVRQARPALRQGAARAAAARVVHASQRADSGL